MKITVFCVHTKKRSYTKGLFLTKNLFILWRRPAASSSDFVLPPIPKAVCFGEHFLRAVVHDGHMVVMAGCRVTVQWAVITAAALLSMSPDDYLDYDCRLEPATMINY